MFQDLCQWIGPDLPERTVPVTKKLLAAIWLFATTESYRSVADRFGFNKGAFHRIVMSVSRALIAKRGDVIHWPQNRELKDLAAQWQGRAGAKGVVGAIDGTYTKIPGMSGEHRDAYICRKGFPAMHLQCIYKYVSFLLLYSFSVIFDSKCSSTVNDLKVNLNPL